jgi:hypothetical protein
MVMKIVLWVIFLSALLVFSLGNAMVIPIPIINSTTKKYKTPDDYYSDIRASQGVFSRTIEPMSNASKSTFSGSNVNAVKGNMFSDTVKGVAASGPNNSGYAIKGPNGIHTGTSPYGKDDVTQWKNEKTQPSCADTLYGCCSDNITTSLEDGSNCPSSSTSSSSTSSSSTSSPYGMCDDGVTPKNSSGSNCSTYPPSSPTIYILPVQSSTTTPTPYTPTTQTQPTTYTQGPPPPTQPTQPPPTQPTTQPVPYTTPTTTPSQPASYTTQPPPTQIPQTNQTTQSPDQPQSQPVPYSSYASQPLPSDQSQTQPVQSSIQAYNTDTVFLSSPQSINSNCPSPQPCPPCGRCPEPSFDCKKVPNYASTNSEYLPVPVLNDFSQFGM